MLISNVLIPLLIFIFFFRTNESKINIWEKRYEYIDLVSNRYNKENLEKIKNWSHLKENLKNKYVFTYYGSSGSNKREFFKRLFDISNDNREFINLGFKQKIDLWHGNDKQKNTYFIIDVDLIENMEILDNEREDFDSKKWGLTIYNLDKLVDFIIGVTNSILVPLEKRDIQMETKNKSFSDYSAKENIIKKECSEFFLPRKIEIFLEKLNNRRKNVIIYFILLEQIEGAFFLKFLNYAKKKYKNLKIYIVRHDKLNMNLLHKQNQNKYNYLLDNIKSLIKEIKLFKNLDSYNNKCVYNFYVIEEAYTKSINYFNHIYDVYEKQIVEGNVIPDYGLLSYNLIINSLKFFNLLTFEQTGTALKKDMIKKLTTIFLNLVKKQILKQLLLLETIYVNKGKDMILQDEFYKKSKALLNNHERIVDLKNKLASEMKKQIQNITNNTFIIDSFFENVMEEFVNQCEEKIEEAIKNCCNLNQSPLKKLFDKKKLKEAIYKKMKTFNPSLNMNLTLTSLIRKRGYGNLQSYLVYDLGLLTFVFGFLNDRDSPDILQHSKEVPFFKFQPKINIKVDWNRAK